MDDGPSITTTRGTSLVLEALDQTYGRSKGPVRLIVTLLFCHFTLLCTEQFLTEEWMSRLRGRRVSVVRTTGLWSVSAQSIQMLQKQMPDAASAQSSSCWVTHLDQLGNGHGMGIGVGCEL
jgi:hypothetical protein